MSEIPFGSIPGSLMTRGNREIERKVKNNNLQIKNIKKDIKENYMSIKKCNDFGLKKDNIEKAVLRGRVRTKKLDNNVYYHIEDVANLL